MLSLNIVTPDRHVIGPVSVHSVTVPGSTGEMTILPSHAQLVSTMEAGILAFEIAPGKKEIAAVSSGFVEIHDDKVVVLADALELAKEIDVDRARRAREAAEKKLKAQESFDDDMERWHRKYKRALIRLQAAEFLLPPH